MLDFTQRIVGEGLTYDDVLLLPSYSEVLPRDVNITGRLSRNIELKVPIVAAAMDTVTEFEMAIAIAQNGGLGMIHKNMSIERQAQEVRKVKRSESGLIVDPIVLSRNALIEEALRLMAENRIGGIPVVDENRKLVGILTNRDLRFETDPQKPVWEVMTRENLITTPAGTSLRQAEGILQEHKIEKLPVVDAEGRLVGLITYKDILKIKDFPMACKDRMGRLRVGAAVGVTADLSERVQALVQAGVDVLTVDTAHAHSRGVLEALSMVKKITGDRVDVVVGNIATGQAAKMLVDASAYFPKSAIVGGWATRADYFEKNRAVVAQVVRGWAAANDDLIKNSATILPLIQAKNYEQVPLLELQEQFKASKYYTVAEWQKLYQDGTAVGWLQQVTDFYARFGGIQNPVPAKTYFDTSLLLNNAKT